MVNNFFVSLHRHRHSAPLSSFWKTNTVVLTLPGLSTVSVARLRSFTLDLVSFSVHGSSLSLDNLVWSIVCSVLSIALGLL